MIDAQCSDKESFQEILMKYTDIFHGVGKLKDHEVKLHTDDSIKPTAEPARTIPYFLEDKVKEVVDDMVRQDIIEEHPRDEPALWTSNIVIVLKDDGDIRLELMHAG